MRATRQALEDAAKAFMRHTLHVSTSQSMCGACGRQVTWATFTPKCEHCGTTWLFVVPGFMISGWSEQDYQLRCQELAPGLRYVYTEALGGTHALTRLSRTITVQKY